MTEQPSFRDVKFADLIEDILGFGARTFHSLKASIISPRDYYAAGKIPDWTGKFSPSVRVYLGLIAVSAVFRFLYAGEDGVMTELYTNQFVQIFDQIEAQKGVRPTISESEMAMTTLRYYFPIAPFVALPLYMIVGLMFQSFGERLNAVVRIRHVFVSVIPATLFMTVLTIAFAFLPNSIIGIISASSMVVAMIMIGITAYRGAFSETMPDGLGKLGRSVGLSALLLIAMLLASFIAIFLAIVIATAQATAAGLM